MAHILVVDDDEMVRATTQAALEMGGHSVVTAEDGREAAQKVEAEKFDLLITDIVMPEMNGRDLAEQLTSQYGKLRSIFMSGYTADVIAPRGVLPEGVHFLQKPFPLKELAARVREVLGNPA